MHRYTRPKPLAWFFFLLAFGTCVGLGSWQVARLQWKQGVIAEIEQAKTQAPLTAKTLPTEDAALKAKNFYPVKLNGRWDSSIEYHLAPRYFRSKMGYHIIQPLVLDDGRTVLVNRGWVPSEKKEIATRKRTIGVGRATITGLLRVGAERNYFTPDNQPQKNVWFGRDVQEMADFYKLKNVYPGMVDVVGTQDVAKLPVPSDGTIRVRNDHLSYIITWYAIALGILVIFVLSHRKKQIPSLRA